MAHYTFTDPELEAVTAAFDAGASHLSDERWAAVHVALAGRLPQGGALEVEIDPEAEADLKAGFAAGREGLAEGGERYLALLGAVDGAARALDVAPSRAPGR